MQLTNTPAEISHKDVFMYILASSNLFSTKFFAKNRCTPEGIPMELTMIEIVVSDTTVEDMPIISVVVILDKTNQKINPPNIEMMDSINK